MKLTSQIPFKIFLIIQILILISGLIFLYGLYYILNVQYKVSSNLFLNGPVTTLPKTLRLDLDQPADDSLTFQSSILVSGRTGPGKDVLIYTDSRNLVIKSKPDGSFSAPLDLNEGVNTIVAVVFDETGDSRTIERTVYFSKEKI